MKAYKDQFGFIRHDISELCAQITDEKLQELRDKVMGVNRSDMPKLERGTIVAVGNKPYNNFLMLIERYHEHEQGWEARRLDGGCHYLIEPEITAVFDCCEIKQQRIPASDSIGVNAAYHPIWQRHASKYRKILQPMIDGMERMVCDGTGYENGRLRGKIEGMKMALEKLEESEKSTCNG